MAVKKKDKGQKKSKNKKEQKSDTKVMEKIRDPVIEKLYENATKENEQYKVRIENLVKTIDNLQETCRLQDNDALEVISTLQRESESKDNKIKLLEGQMNSERENARLEKESIIKDYESQLSELRDVLKEKETSLRVIKDEFNVLKDFRRKRRELMQELERKNNDMIEIERTNKDKIERLEKKFFEEKVRLQKETNKKLAELASKAHQEAILNLKQTTKEVYKENLRMADALRYHVMEGEDLHKLNNQLSITNKQLLEEKDLNSIIVKEKIMQSKKQNDQIKELQNKVMSMEYTLSHIVREFDQEKEIISKLAKQEIDKVRYTVDTLKCELDIRIKQMKQIRRIAQHILDQRSDLETFFMDALDHVRLEICREREEKRRREAEEYNKKIKSALNPRAADAIEQKEMEERKKNIKPNSNKIDITQLSWKDKERVLRVLFAKMNGIAMQSADGNEENKISGSDYKLNENTIPRDDEEEEGGENENSRIESNGEYIEEETMDKTEEYSGGYSDEEEGEGVKVGEEVIESIHDTDIDSLEDYQSIDIQEHMKQRKDSHKETIEKMKKQQEQQQQQKQERINSISNNNNSNNSNKNNKDNYESQITNNSSDRIPSPHPPSDEPTNKEMISINKKRSSSSLSYSSLTNRNNKNQSNSNSNNLEEKNNKESSPLMISPEMDEKQYIENAKEIMKSDESLDKFIEEGMNSIKKSEEELVAQSEETFDEFLKRSYSQNMDSGAQDNQENENQ